MSADSIKRQKNFCDKESFDFPILSDENKTILKDYGAWGIKKMYGREYEGIYRYTYVIDEKGIMRDTVGNNVYITTEDMTDNMIEMFMLLAEKKFIEKNKEEE